MDLGQIATLLTDRYGFAFDDLRRARLGGAIRARMRAAQVANIGTYLRVLQSDPTELDRLVNLLTIKETYFYREPEHLILLANHLLPEIVRDLPEGAEVKIVSAGCSTGEEPYSIAIALLESGDSAPRTCCRIHGFDVDASAIHRAREGVYGKTSFRCLPENLREKYFEAAGPGRYRVKDFVRERVHLHRLNLLDASWPEHLDEAHVILYRNVSIYLERSVQRRVFERLSRLLRDRGSLLLASAETLSHDNGLLQLQELNGVFFFRKSAPPASAQPHAQRSERKPQARAAAPERAAAAVRAGREAPRRRRPIEQRWAHARRLYAERNYDDALGIVDTILEEAPDFLRAYSLKAAILFIQKRSEDARRTCKRVLEQDPLAVECHVLLGSIARNGGDEEEASREFRAAIYAEPSCWLAHFFVAEWYRRQPKNLDTARREYRAAAQILEVGDLRACREHTCVPMSFSSSQILQVCRRQEAALEGKRR